MTIACFFCSAHLPLWILCMPSELEEYLPIVSSPIIGVVLGMFPDRRVGL